MTFLKAQADTSSVLTQEMMEGTEERRSCDESPEKGNQQFLEIVTARETWESEQGGLF